MGLLRRSTCSLSSTLTRRMALPPTYQHVQSAGKAAYATNATSGPATRVAILDCDETVPEVAKLHGPRYSDLFIAILRQASSRSSNPTPKITQYSAFDVRAGHFPDPEKTDAILITGGVAAAYDPDPWIANLAEYIKTIHNQHRHIRLFGACFGHQIIAHALLSPHGVVVELNPKGRQFGIRSVTLNPLYAATLGPSHRDRKTMRIQVVHGDHVRLPAATTASTNVPSEGSTTAIATPSTGNIHGLPPGWISIGSTDCCDLHGLYLPDRVLTLQGHFEFTSAISSQSIEYFFTPERGYDPTMISAAIKSTEGDDDSLVAAELVLDFLTGKPDNELDIGK